MRIEKFSGLIPKMGPKYLPDGNATIAENLDIYGNRLKPINMPRATGEILLTPCGAMFSGTPKSVHRAGSVLVAWEDYTHVSPDWTRKLGDTSFLFVQDGVLYRQSAERILAGKCPIKVGIKRPSCEKITVSVETQAGCEAKEIIPICVPYNTCDNIEHPPVPVAYLFTYMNACGEESAPSCPSDVMEIRWGDAVVVDVADPNTPDNAVSRRWYRAVADNEANTHWLFVGETPIQQTVFYDMNCQCQWADELSTETHDAPPECLEGVAVIGTNMTIVWSNRHFWVSERNFPHAYNIDNEYRLRYQIQGMYEITSMVEGGVHYNLIAITDGLHYSIQADEPGKVIIAEMQQRYKCYSNTAVRTESQIIYSAPQGLVAVTMQGEELLTGQYMTEHEWVEFLPETLKLVYHDDRIYGFNRKGGFIYQIGRDKRRDADFVTHTVVIDVGYTDETSRFLLFKGKDVYEWGKGTLGRYDWKSKTYVESGTWRPITCKIVSPAFNTQKHRGFSKAKIAYEEWVRTHPFSPSEVFFNNNPKYQKHMAHLVRQTPSVEVILYADGREYYRRHVRSNKPFLLPRRYKAIDWAVRVKGQIQIDEIHLQSSRESLIGDR